MNPEIRNNKPNTLWGLDNPAFSVHCPVYTYCWKSFSLLLQVVLLLCQLISIVIIQVKQNHYSPSVVSKMSMHSWTILFLTFVKVIHVNGTLINREPILGKLFGRSPNRIFGCPGRGPFFPVVKLGWTKNSRRVKNSSHGLTDNLSKVRGYFFSRGEVKISLGNI